MCVCVSVCVCVQVSELVCRCVWVCVCVCYGLGHVKSCSDLHLSMYNIFPQWWWLDLSNPPITRMR